MTALFPDAMPLAALTGGAMLGLAAAIMLLGLGRIAGVSGLLARATGIAGSGAPRPIALAFILGLPLGAWLMARAGHGASVSFPAAVWPLLLGGVLVGYGTRLGSGCTSGHGVCGVSRLSPRSVSATVLFMASGLVTATLLHPFIH